MAAVNKTNILRQYWLDTMDDQASRTYEDFIEKGYADPADFSKTDFNNKSFSIKLKTEEELRAALEKENKKGNYATPTVSSSPSKLSKHYSSTSFEKEEYFDDSNINPDNKEDVLLGNLRKGCEDLLDESLPIEERVKAKFDRVYDTIYDVARGHNTKIHAFVYGDAGIGKSYTVAKAAQAGQKKWEGPLVNGKAPDLIFSYGSVGSAMSSLLAFFFTHQKYQIIILDDADGFVLSPDQDVQNFLKAMLDPDTHPIGVPQTILDKAEPYYQAELERVLAEKEKAERDAIKKAEAAKEGQTGFEESARPGVLISVDTNRLNEGIVGVTVNNKYIESRVSKEEAKLLKETFPGVKVTEAAQRIFEARKASLSKFDKFGKLRTIREGDILDRIDMSAIKNDEYANAVANVSDDAIDAMDELPPHLKNNWIFDSRLIMISNLDQSDLNDAIESRCDCVPLYLSPEEFMVHAEAILPDLEVGKKAFISKDLIEWAKKEAFAIFKACVRDMKTKNSKINLKINVHLELRLIISMTGRMISRFDRWCQKKGYEASIDNVELLQEFELEQAPYFIEFDLKPLMSGNARE